MVGWGDGWSGARKRQYLCILECSQLGLFFFVTLPECWCYFVKGEGIVLGMENGFLPLAAFTCYHGNGFHQPGGRILLQSHALLDCCDFEGKYLQLCR